MNDRCELCGEEIDYESTVDPGGEFHDPEKEGAVIAHAQCGLDAGLEPA